MKMEDGSSSLRGINVCKFWLNLNFFKKMKDHISYLAKKKQESLTEYFEVDHG